MARWLYDCRPLSGHPWRVGVATEDWERDAIFRLRYDVFVTEQGYGHAGTDAGPGRDVDHFDAWCDHLFIYDEERGKVAGAYRAIRGDEALRRGGFYARDEFDMTPLAPLAPDVLQCGRTCVAAEYRGTQAFQYLSYGMDVLLREDGRHYLMAASSFRADLDEVCRINSYLLKFRADPDWSVRPWEANAVAGLRDVPVTEADERSLPEILRMDVRVGFRACGPPAWDPGFGCYDVLMLGRRDRFSRLYHGVVERIGRQLAAAGGP